MNYRTSFQNLLRDPQWKGAYIGQGNPNANILIIGREHGFANEAQAILEIEKNWHQWSEILNDKDPTEFGYSPRHCYAKRNQEFRIAPNTGGASATWYVYQKIVNALLPHVMIDGEHGKILDFYEYSFITEFSTVNRRNNNNNTQFDVQATADSIAERIPLLSAAFFRSFPIVILSCGKYYDQYHIDFENMFDVKWEGPTKEIKLGNGKKVWLNIHYSADRQRIVIHTWQASAFTHGTEETYKPFFEELSKLR